MSLRVLNPGLFTLVVDFGRPRTRSLGVPVGGAADRTALAIGNSLVGNAPNAPALEITLAGPTLEAGCNLGCVVYGARFELAIRPVRMVGTPITPSPRQEQGRKVVAGKTFTLHAGEQLQIGGTNQGGRAYLCIRGGLTVPEVLGSHSGLEPIHSGEVLPCQAGYLPSTFALIDWHRDLDLPGKPGLKVLRVLPGAQTDWFPAAVLNGRYFAVTPVSNRMGLRLLGEPLPVPHRELISEPVCPGSVQVTRDGQCIILGVDGQTIGGYPKIAQVISVDLDRLGQLRPGDTIIFQEVALDQAEWLAHLHAQELRHWTLRLRTAAS